MKKSAIDKMLKVDSAKGIIDEVSPVIEANDIQELIVIWMDSEGGHMRGTCGNVEAVGHLEVTKQCMVDDALGYRDDEEGE